MMGILATLTTVLGLLITNKHTVTANVDTNEIFDEPMQNDLDLPACRNGAACGYVQVNAFGVSSRQFCSCRTGGGGGGGGVQGMGVKEVTGTCSMVWDPEDGRSVTMGSQQFKYCGAPPPLRVCKKDEPAYTAGYHFQRVTFRLLEESHVVRCLCHPPLAHVHSDVEEYMSGGARMVMDTIYTCSNLPPCASKVPCKEVTVGDGTALVYPKCRCPQHSACPTLTSTAVLHSNSYPKGAAYSINCLPLF